MKDDPQRVVNILYDQRYLNAAFIDLRYLERAWINNKAQQLLHYAIKPAYYSRWFVKKGKAEYFELADIEACPGSNTITPINGRHRTSALRKRMYVIPLSYGGSLTYGDSLTYGGSITLEYLEKTGSFLRNARYGEEFSIPDLQVLTIGKLRAGQLRSWRCIFWEGGIDKAFSRWQSYLT